jgi:GNAT superfamily N-acetyltransferase
MTEIDLVKAFLRESDERVCDERRPTPHGVALLTPSLPLVWQLNAIRVDDSEANAGSLAADADELLANVAHRKLVVRDEELGVRLAPALSAQGWNALRLLVMVRRRAPDRPAEAGLAAEVSREQGAAVLAAFRREQPFGWQEEAIRQLRGMDERFARAWSTRDFAAPVDEPGCSCRLYSDGSVAQVDEVGTLEPRRGHGYARATVLAAADAAAADGCEPVFLLTDASDWPQHLYRKLGFDAIGAVYEFLKLPIKTAGRS